MKSNKNLLFIVFLVVSFSSIFATEAPIHAEWANGAVGYQIFFKSFYDSDGDGIGDFNGITAKLDYLNDGKPGGDDLGVDFIWLTPIFKSGSFHGYDVKDYYTLEPKLGTMEDFQRLLDEAHKRGIKIIMDFVINHCSEKHPFFQDALNNKNSDKRDWFIFSDQPKTWPIWDNIPHDFTRGKNNDYYWGTFGRNPDWNLKNSEVTAYFYDVAQFWMKKGVGGFRIDAARHLIEDEIDGKIVTMHTPATLKWLKDFTHFIQSSSPEALIIGEVWDEADKIGVYTDPATCGISATFNFPVRTALEELSKNGADTLGAVVADSKSYLHKNAIDIIFTGNHDIPRLATLIPDQEMLKMAAKIILLTPGTPMIYYGDELGMQGAANSSGDITYRPVFPWNNGPNAGFTAGPKAGALLPANWEERNAESELKNKKSIVSTYRELIQLRKNLPDYAKGKFAGQDSTKEIYSFYVTGKSHDYFVAINVTAKSQKLVIDASKLYNVPGLIKGQIVKLEEVNAKNMKPIEVTASEHKNLGTLKGYQAKIYEIKK